MDRRDPSHDRDGVAEANGWRVVKLGERNVGWDWSDSQCNDTVRYYVHGVDYRCQTHLSTGAPVSEGEPSAFEQDLETAEKAALRRMRGDRTTEDP